ncbi:hypothetical protein EJ08DRAFT_309710 [Tothia fuscella]|uniref:Uncharacterized protein n=1 Tax=Tothia fuscella TaxID=1048955 RepID=A0A9P4NPK4_9PEZI|nr:hypothetical protein EJ08DRAFT_309710 [Tothia fuscella]
MDANPSGCITLGPSNLTYIKGIRRPTHRIPARSSTNMASGNRRPTARVDFFILRVLIMGMMLGCLGILSAVFAAPHRLLPKIDFQFYEFGGAASHPIWELITVNLAIVLNAAALYVSITKDEFTLLPHTLSGWLIAGDVIIGLFLCGSFFTGSLFALGGSQIPEAVIGLEAVGA